MALRFNLKALILRRRPAMRGKRVTFREITPTGQLQRDLERILIRVVISWWQGSRDRLIPAYRSSLNIALSAGKAPILDDATSLGGDAASLAEEIDRLIIQLTSSLRNWGVTIERWHREKWASSLTPSGIDLRTLIGPEDVAETVEARIQANVSLIRSISSEARSRIEGIIFRGFTARTPTQTIAREISAAVSMSRRRALNIAADQTTKLSAELDTARMEQAGIEEFTWIHSGKVHPRPWHRERNGKRFDLRGEIAPDDMPGVPPFCGCKKRAELSLD